MISCLEESILVVLSFTWPCWMLMDACFILLKAIWIQGGSSAGKGKEAWICRQPKWSILCTGSTKTSPSHVHNSRRNASWWKGDLNIPLDFFLVRHLMFLLAKNSSVFYFLVLTVLLNDGCSELWLFLLKKAMEKREWMRFR